MAKWKTIRRGSKKEEEFWKVAKFHVYDYDAHGTQDLYNEKTEAKYARKDYDRNKHAVIRIWDEKSGEGSIHIHSNLFYKFKLPKGFIDSKPKPSKKKTTSNKKKSMKKLKR